MNKLKAKNRNKNYFLLLLIVSTILPPCLIFTLSALYNTPNYKELSNYLPQSITRLYDRNGQILDEYFLEKRIYIRYIDIPKVMIDAFIAVEDKNFFIHQGIDGTSIIRALLYNVLNINNNKRLIGGSTITQQVAKSIFLTNERKFSRKIKEAVLAYRINKAFSKKRILEIYLNQIYLGHRSYGIYVATKNYFGKNIARINIQEAAMIASLPKAPSILNPYNNYERAIQRRNWAIKKMEKEGFLTLDEAITAINTPIKLNGLLKETNVFANFYTNTVKSELINLFDRNIVYSSGLVVNTNMDIKLQNTAQTVLENGLYKLDKKQSYREMLHSTNLKHNITQNLYNISINDCHNVYYSKIYNEIDDSNLTAIIVNRGKKIEIATSIKWIVNNTYYISKQLRQELKLEDIALLNNNNCHHKLKQEPPINGAIVIIENISGKILALVGGRDYKSSKFNRAIQANRQIGSIFKTFIYLGALEQGIAPNTLILDKPIQINLGYHIKPWKPKNFDGKYRGLVTVRSSFEESRNLSTLRLLLGLGLNEVARISQKYLIYNHNITPNYSIGLGSYTTNLLKITNAYASIANNGNIKQPKLIDSVYDRYGNLVYAPQDLYYETTTNQYSKNRFSPPKIGFLAKKVTDDATNYQILSLLEGVIKRGSAKKAKILNRTIAGKTGTTNNNLDTWFIGMTPDITVGIFIGYDIPRNIGGNATGSNVSLPIFIDFLQKSTYIPDRGFDIPLSIIQHFTNQKTGNIINKENFVYGKKYVLENFKSIYTKSISSFSDFCTKEK